MCPAGQRSRTWRPTHDRYGTKLISIKFATSACRPCPHRLDCARSHAARRMLTIRPEAQFRALQQTQEQQTTDAYATVYSKRAGVEGTLSAVHFGVGGNNACFLDSVNAQGDKICGFLEALGPALRC